MSLTDPTVGDLLDRLSILRLKIAQGERLALPITYFRTEQKEILDRLPAGWQATFKPDVDRLFDVNELLWHETDALRAIAVTGETIQQARLGLHILRLNDERSRLIAAINQIAGDFRLEKLA